MINDNDIATLMTMIGDDDQSALTKMLEQMDNEDSAYFKGYVDGYVDAVRHLQMSESETSSD